MMIILIAVAVLLLAVIYVPQWCGYTPYAVTSGSMVATNLTDETRNYFKEEYNIETLTGYDVGSLIYVKKTDFADIKPGDAITFKIGGNTVVTHMVIEKNEEEQTFVTHGIANSIGSNEHDIRYGDVIGEAGTFSIPNAGYLLNWMSGTQAKILAITYIVLFVILLVAESLLEKLTAKEETENNTEQSDDIQNESSKE